MNSEAKKPGEEYIDWKAPGTGESEQSSETPEIGPLERAQELNKFYESLEQADRLTITNGRDAPEIQRLVMGLQPCILVGGVGPEDNPIGDIYQRSPYLKERFRATASMVMAPNGQDVVGENAVLYDPVALRRAVQKNQALLDAFGVDIRNDENFETKLKEHFLNTDASPKGMVGDGILLGYNPEEVILFTINSINSFGREGEKEQIRAAIGEEQYRANRRIIDRWLSDRTCSAGKLYQENPELNNPEAWRRFLPWATWTDSEVNQQEIAKSKAAFSQLFKINPKFKPSRPTKFEIFSRFFAFLRP